MRLDIFLDDILNNEFLLRGKPRNLPNLQRRLFIALLLRIGGDCDYASLFDRIWGDEATKANTFHQLLRNLHKNTEGLLKPHISVPPRMERIYVDSGIRAELKYAAIFMSGVYDYSLILRSIQNPSVHRNAQECGTI